MKKYLPVIAIIALYYATVFFGTANFPINDDYEILKFLCEYKNATSVQDKFDLFVMQNNEHRPAFTRLIFLAYYNIFGTINFRNIAVIGNLAILGIFSIFLNYIKMRKISGGQYDYLYLFVLSCLLFQYGFAGSSIWAMCSISHYFVLFFSLTSIVLICERVRLKFILGLLTSIIAVYTSGHAIAVYVVCLPYLFIRRYFYRFFTLFVTFSIVATLYFWNYVTHGYHSNPLDYKNILDHLLQILVYIMAFLGSAFGIGNPAYPVATGVFVFISAVIGLGMFVFWVYLTCKMYYLKNNVLYWFGLYAIINAVCAAVTRIPYGLWQSMASRYHIVSVVMLISMGLLFLEILEERNIKISRPIMKKIVIASIFYLVFTTPILFYYLFMYYAPAWRGEIIHVGKTYASNILQEARQQGLFK